MTERSEARPRWWEWRRRDEATLGSDVPTSRGYVAGSSRLALATNGLEMPVSEVAATRPLDVLVWGLNAQRRCVARSVAELTKVGRMSVSTLTLRSGRYLQAPEAEEVITPDGWATLDSLAPGDRVAVVGMDPEPLDVVRVSDGVIDATARALVGGGVPDLPMPVAQAPRDQVAHFLQLIWEQAGTVRPGPEHGYIYLALPSERASIAVARMLLRFGVEGRISRWGGGFVIKDTDAICAYLDVVAPATDRTLAALAAQVACHPQQERLDHVFWDQVMSIDVGDLVEVWRVAIDSGDTIVVNGLFVGAARI